MTVSKAADRSSNISNEDLEAVLASLRASTEQGSFSRMFTSETRLVVIEEVVLFKKGRDLVEHNSFKCF